MLAVLLVQDTAMMHMQRARGCMAAWLTPAGWPGARALVLRWLLHTCSTALVDDCWHLEMLFLVHGSSLCRGWVHGYVQHGNEAQDAQDVDVLLLA